MAIKCCGIEQLGGLYTRINTQHITMDGILKSKGTYEIISPANIDLRRAAEFGIVLGKFSGFHALRTRLL